MVLLMKSVIVLAGIVLIIGLIRPKWVLFWMKQPDRLLVSTIAMILFMSGWTGLAKLTLKPKEKSPAQQRSVEDQNELQLDKR